MSVLTIMRTAVFAAILVPLAGTAYGQEPSVVVVCERGTITGTRMEIDESGHTVVEDGATFPSIVYAFDVPERGLVRILVGTQEVVATILNEYPTYKTVAYKFGGVSFMDTVFFEANKVVKSEHKYLFGVSIATTWSFDCVFER